MVLPGLLEERVVEKCFEINSVFGIAFEKVNQEMSELRGGTRGDSRSEFSILLIELFQCLGCLGLKLVK